MTLEVVVLGTGMMGRIVAPIIRQAGGEVVAVAGSTEEKAQEFIKKQKLPNVKAIGTLTNYEHLFRHGNTVAVLTPNYLHVPQALAAVKAGKNVLVEKPLGVNVQECCELQRAAFAVGVAVEVNSQYRHTEVLNVLRDRIAQTKAEEPVLVRIGYIQDWQESPQQSIGWRPIVKVAGKGKLTGDLGVHALQTTLDLFGGQFEVASFEGQTYNVHPVRYEFKGNVGSFGGGEVPSFTDRPDLYEQRDMFSDEFSGDDLATAKWRLRADTGAIVDGRYALSQVTHGNANNFTIDVIFENGDHYFWSQENPNHLDYKDAFGTRQKIQRTSAPSISGRPSGHPKGYGDAILDELLKLDNTIESGSSSQIRAYTHRNLTHAVESMLMIQKWNENPLLSYTGGKK
jgi:predicted dehydrogenase